MGVTTHYYHLHIKLITNICIISLKRQFLMCYSNYVRNIKISMMHAGTTQYVTMHQ